MREILALFLIFLVIGLIGCSKLEVTSEDRDKVPADLDNLEDLDFGDELDNFSIDVDENTFK